MWNFLKFNGSKMFIVYENSLLNKLIISFSNLANVPEDNLVAFEDVETEPFDFLLDLPKKISDDPEVLFLCSTTILTKRLVEILRKTPKDFEFIISIKDFETANKDDFIPIKTTNWRNYWMSCTNTLKTEGCPKELFESVMAHQRGIANIAQRRIHVALSSATCMSKQSFTNFIRSSTDVVQLQRVGMEILLKLESQIQKDKNTCLDRTIDGKRYTVVVSNIIESAFQLFEMTGGSSTILLCQMNLSKQNVIVHILTKKEGEITILENQVLSKDGRFQKAILTTKAFSKLFLED
jgi:hypothetical protein